MPAKIAMQAGERYGKWVTLEERPGFRWLCRCDCGIEREVSKRSIRAGISQSCGSMACSGRVPPRSITTHGATRGGRRLAEYGIWRSMLARCRNPNVAAFPRYGGRGVLVVSRWNSFENFIADMGFRQSNEYSLDRINNDGHYEPGNVRWATRREQARNTRKTIFLTVGGVTRSAAEWSELTGINQDTITSRIRRGEIGQLALLPSHQRISLQRNTP